MSTTAKTLVIMESPHKAKVVSGFLDSSYIVRASVGHIRDLPEPKRITAEEKKRYGSYAIDVNSGNFEALYKNAADKAKVIKDLKEQLAKCDSVVLYTDGDDEGAAISWHLLEVLKPKVPVYRATTLEITEKAVKEGLKNKKLIDQKAHTPKEFYGAAESALTRGSWDRLYGFGTTPYVWKVISNSGSSGRVQTPAARLVVEREEKRLAFKSISYYSISGNFEGNIAKLIEIKGKKVADSSHIDDEGNVKDGYLLITDELVDKIIAHLKKKSYSVEDIKSKPYKRSAPPPFTTSSALQSIGAKTRMSSKQITSILQSEYTNGFLTYIRTVSVVAAPEAIKSAREQIEKLYGKQYLNPTIIVHKNKSDDNSGHECIRPVLDPKDNLINHKFNDPKEQIVFDLIRKRMLASQGADCLGTTYTAIFKADGEDTRFSASETEITQEGWTKIYQEDDADDQNEGEN